MSADDKVNVALNVRGTTFLRRNKRSMGTQTRIHNMVGGYCNTYTVAQTRARKEDPTRGARQQGSNSHISNGLRIHQRLVNGQSMSIVNLIRTSVVRVIDFSMMWMTWRDSKLT